MRAPVYKPFAESLSPGRARALPPATVVAGSLLATWPVVAKVGIMPPFGLLVLLAWRLLAPNALRTWSPALLGFFDDLVSGQPLGSAVLLWSLAFFVVDLFDQRLMFRAFAQDWLIAAVAITLVLVGGRFVALPFGVHVDAVLVVQIMVSILLFPLAAGLCSWLDRKRGPQ